MGIEKCGFHDVTAKKLILVVDDEPEMTEAISEYLIMRGFFVSTATNGKEMHHILENNSIDLVLLDLGADHHSRLGGYGVLEPPVWSSLPVGRRFHRRVPAGASVRSACAAGGGSTGLRGPRLHRRRSEPG